MCIRAGQSLGHFPHIEVPHDCKRISVRHNSIRSESLPELGCPKLVSLALGDNRDMGKIPDGFFLNFTSLKVLELSWIPALKSLPPSLWQLTQLEFLDLSGTMMESIPVGIGNLFRLQFLSFCNCYLLKSLPCEIGKLEKLKYLDLQGLCYLEFIPKEIKMLSKCKILESSIQDLLMKKSIRKFTTFIGPALKGGSI